MDRNDAFNFSSTAKLAFSVHEVRALTGLSKSSIYRLLNAGQLRSVKVAGRRFVMRCDLEELFARSVSAPCDRLPERLRRAADEA